MTTRYYKLVDKTPVEIKGVSAIRSYQSGRTARKIGHYQDNDFIISTHFLGVDHDHDKGEPQLFETIVLDIRTDANDYALQQSYTTWNQAMSGHKEAIKLIKSGEFLVRYCEDEHDR